METISHTGNPNIDKSSTWQSYNVENGGMMIFDNNCRIRNNPNRKLEEIINIGIILKQLDKFNKNHNN